MRILSKANDIKGQLEIGEKIDFLSVVDVSDQPTEKGGEG